MEDLVDYKEKYLKYKLKYLKLEAELEGGLPPPIVLVKGAKAAARVGQSIGRVGKQIYKYSSGKYDDEINEINHILNRTVYLQDGKIIYDVGINPCELQNAEMLYSNTDLLTEGTMSSGVNTTVNKGQELNSLPKVEKFLDKVKEKITAYKVRASDQNVSELERATFQDGVKSLERILEIHYMCKGVTGITQYTSKDCFKNIRVKNSLNNQNYQCDQNGQRVQYDQYGRPIQYDQYGRPIQYDQYGRRVQTGGDYKQKYYKYKAKYYQLVEFVEQNGGFSTMSNLYSAGKEKLKNVSISSSISSLASKAKKGISIISGKNAENINRVRQILKENEEFASVLGIVFEAEEKKVKENLAAKKKLITDLETKLYSCKKNTGDKVYNLEGCFEATKKIQGTQETQGTQQTQGNY